MAAMRPGRENAHKCQNQYHQKYGSEVHDVLQMNQALMVMEKMIRLGAQADSQERLNVGTLGFKGHTQMHPALESPEPAPPSELATQHRQCAELHERASRHFREAARLYENRDKDQASYHSSIARRNASSALKADELQDS
jgi:hypothetical protein